VTAVTVHSIPLIAGSSMQGAALRPFNAKQQDSAEMQSQILGEAVHEFFLSTSTEERRDHHHDLASPGTVQYRA
jgi:hypothetical protein